MSIRFWEKRDFFTEIFLFRPFCKKAPEKSPGPDKKSFFVLTARRPVAKVV